MKSKSLKHSLNKVDEHIIGLWKFREFGRKPVWCTTFRYKGNYYDTTGRATPEAALAAMDKALKKAKKTHE